MKYKIFFLVVLLLLSSCSTSKYQVIKDPDSPLIIGDWEGESKKYEFKISLEVCQEKEDLYINFFKISPLKNDSLEIYFDDFAKKILVEDGKFSFETSNKYGYDFSLAGYFVTKDSLKAEFKYQKETVKKLGVLDLKPF